MSHPNATEVKAPEQSVLALEMLAHGEKYADIARATGLRPTAVVALRRRHEGALVKSRERAAEEMEDLAELYREVGRERAEALLNDPEAMAKVNLKDPAIGAAVWGDKALLLRGEATARIDHRRGASLADVKEALEAASKAVALKKVKGEAIDV